MSCSYDLCLNCCQDLREVSMLDCKGEEAEQETLSEQVKPSRLKLTLADKFSAWKSNNDGSVPCPPKDYGGCGFSSLTLTRIFKMNWVAKLVKNVEEMVTGCKVYDIDSPQKTRSSDRFCQSAHREDADDNVLYCPSSEDIKTEGIGNFRKHWIMGEPVIVKQVCDSSSISSWDPSVIWRGIRETSDEKMKDDKRMVKAIDCLDWSEVGFQT